MRRFIKEYVLENWNLKITAILLALMLWLIVRSEPGLERVIRGVPLEVQLPRHMEITREDPTSVEVTVRGAALSDLLLTQPAPTTCLVHLSGAKEGENVITLTPENVKISRGSGIDVTQVNPARVTIVLERTVSKEVPITVPVRGEPSQGFEIYSRTFRPAVMTISGPRSHVEAVREITTEAISIGEQRQPVRFFVGLNIKDNFIRPSSPSPVQVDIQVGPRRKLFTVAEIPLTIDDADYVTVPRFVSAKILAPAQAPGDLTAANFRASVSINSLGSSTLPAKVKPVVTILNNSGGMVSIKTAFPAEVTIQNKKR